jgi:peptidoglycan/LPS O-acetylase OafA/YrhL
LKHRLVHLDCLRGLAALLVVVEHLRAFLFVPFPQVKAPGILTKVFYLVTGLGHQAVMIFFVLSGFLVGGSVITALQRGKWSWRAYLLRRMSRLWVVLIPALLLTLFWDKLGCSIAPGGYHGDYRELYHSGPTPAIPADWSITTFFGNAFFLQTILVPCFGTNGPLWSLANEFWYYLLFPLLILLVIPRTRVPSRIACLLLATGILLFLPKQILIGGLIWLLGAGVFYLIQIVKIRRVTSHPVWLILSLMFNIAALLGSRSGRIGEGADLLIGIGCATLVAGVATRGSTSYFYGMLSAGASEISYTLYLVHFPVLAFLFFGFFRGGQMAPGLITASWFAITLGGVLLYSVAIWWFFERNTERVRKFVVSQLSHE